MSHAVRRLTALKAGADLYGAEQANQAVAKKRALAKQRSIARRRRLENERRKKARATPFTRLPFDEKLWDRAAGQIEYVRGVVPGDSVAIEAAVHFAFALLKRGTRPRMAMHLACREIGVSRDDLSRAVLSMKGSK